MVDIGFDNAWSEYRASFAMITNQQKYADVAGDPPLDLSALVQAGRQLLFHRLVDLLDKACRLVMPETEYRNAGDLRGRLRWLDREGGLDDFGALLAVARRSEGIRGAHDLPPPSLEDTCDLVERQLVIWELIDDVDYEFSARLGWHEPFPAAAPEFGAVAIVEARGYPARSMFSPVADAIREGADIDGLTLDFYAGLVRRSERWMTAVEEQAQLAIRAGSRRGDIGTHLRGALETALEKTQAIAASSADHRQRAAEIGRELEAALARVIAVIASTETLPLAGEDRVVPEARPTT